MKVKICFIVFTFLFAFGAQAKHVTVENAQSVAQKYLSQTTGGVTLRSAHASSYTLVYTAKKEESSVSLRSAPTGDEDAYFYIFNTPDGKGFIIVAADDRAYPVLGYSFKSAFDYAKAPPVLIQWLMGYQEEIEKGLTVYPQREVNPEWQKIGNGIMLSSENTTLGTAEWGQRNPFNLQCPLFDGQRTVTGCVATAMAIVLKYNADNGFAATGTGSHSYKWGLNTLTADFGTYEYEKMPNTSSGFTNDEQRNAVARLMSHCGISVEADYGAGTMAHTEDVPKALALFFGYDQSTEFLNRESFTDEAWKNLIKSEIDNNRPIIYRGHDVEGGHAFICEGYDDDDKYAFNWGWNGEYNGFFRLNTLLPGNGYDFSEKHGMVIGMKEGSGNTADINQIWLTPYDGATGMSKDVENIVQNRSFTVTAGALENTSYNAFRGLIAVVLTDESGHFKEVLSTPSDRTDNPLNPGRYITTQRSCRITITIAPTDLIRMATSTDNGATWKIIKGKTGTVDFLTVGIQNIAVASVSLNSNAETLTVGGTFQLTPTITPANATNKNVTWKSSDENVAEVNASGIVTAIGTGEATITVTTADGGKTANCKITVKEETVNVNEVSLNSNAETLTVGGTFQLTPTITPANATNKNVTWKSSDETVAEVNATGLVTAKTTGESTITVTTTDGGKEATCKITVQAASTPVTGVSLNSNAETLIEGGTFQLTATIMPTNATNKNVTWKSSDATVAEVSTSGLVTAMTKGTATITVTTEDGGKEATCTIAVQEATVIVTVTSVSLNTSTEMLPIGGTFQLIATIAPTDATNKNVTWTSSNSSIASVNSSGLVTMQSVGTATITVSTEDGGNTATCTFTSQPQTINVDNVTLNSNSETLMVGGTFQLIPTVTPTDANNKNVTWSSSNATVASVNTSGLVTANATGTATITVTTVDGGKTATCTITVQPSTVVPTGVTLNSNAETLIEGSTFQLTETVAPANATNKNVTWSSSNASVASVSLSGLVTANAVGTATITVTTISGGHSATCTITVQPIVPTGVTLNSNAETLTEGNTFQLTATVAPSNATNKNVTWSSSNASIASVNSSGLVTANAVGTATITVQTDDGGKTATCAFTVTSQYRATGTTGALTWTLTYTGTLTISGNGAMPDYNLNATPWSNYYYEIFAIVMEQGVTSIGNYAFSNCVVSTSIILPNGLTRIGAYGIHNTQISSIDLPNTLITIDEMAFHGNYITNLYIPASVQNIGNRFAWSCFNLSAITVDPNNSYYSSFDGVLFNKNQTVLIEFPRNKTGNFAIPATVATLQYPSPFEYNESLNSIDIPSSLIDLGSYPFMYCRNLTSINVANSNPNYSSQDGVLYNKNKTILLNYPPNKTGTSFEIPNTVTTIGYRAIENVDWSHLNTLKIPSSVNNIYDMGIRCLSLTSVIVDNMTPPNLSPVGLDFISSTVLHVPLGSLSTYLSTSPWSDFGTIVEDASLHSAPYYGITGDEGLSAGLTKTWLQGNILHVTSPVAENVTIYSLSGSALYQAKKSAGSATFNLGVLPNEFLIVRGSSGWALKIVKN